MCMYSVHYTLCVKKLKKKNIPCSVVKRTRQYWKLLLSEAFSFLSYYIYSVHVYNVDLHVHVIHVCLNVEKNVYELSVQSS